MDLTRQWSWRFVHAVEDGNRLRWCGHRVQRLRLIPVLDGATVTYPCVRQSCAADVPGADFIEFMEPSDFINRLRGRSCMIAHAGMKSIVSALGHGKPIIIMPWNGELGETRHDHQSDDARGFNGRRGISVAKDETKITPMLDHFRSAALSASRTSHDRNPGTGPGFRPCRE